MIGRKKVNSFSLPGNLTGKTYAKYPLTLNCH